MPMPPAKTSSACFCITILIVVSPSNGFERKQFTWYIIHASYYIVQCSSINSSCIYRLVYAPFQASIDIFKRISPSLEAWWYTIFVAVVGPKRVPTDFPRAAATGRVAPMGVIIAVPAEAMPHGHAPRKTTPSVCMRACTTNTQYVLSVSSGTTRRLQGIPAVCLVWPTSRIPGTWYKHGVRSSSGSFCWAGSPISV